MSEIGSGITDHEFAQLIFAVAHTLYCKSDLVQKSCLCTLGLVVVTIPLDVRNTGTVKKFIKFICFNKKIKK